MVLVVTADNKDKKGSHQQIRAYQQTSTTDTCFMKVIGWNNFDTRFHRTCFVLKVFLPFLLCVQSA